MAAVMKAVRLHGINDLRCENVDIPEISGDEILMKIGACGICGSDMQRVYETGAHVMPLTIGHEFAGTVVDVANKDDAYLIGRRAAVFPLIPCMGCGSCRVGHYAQCENYNYLGSRCDGGFAEYCVIPSKWQLIFAEREDVSSEELCITEPATVAQHAIRKSALRGGGTIVIIGAGPIGLLVARWAKIFGARKIMLVDISQEKVEFARRAGFFACGSDEETASKIFEETDGRGACAVIEGTGTSSGLNLAIETVKTFGNIVLMGNPHRDTLIDYRNHSRILRKEIALGGVWNSVYAEYPMNEWKYTVEMIEKKELAVRDLITHRSDLEHLPGLFDGIHDREVTICKAIYSAGISQATDRRM